MQVSGEEVFKDLWSKKQKSSPDTKEPRFREPRCSALPDRRRRPVATPVVSPVVAQQQLADVAPPADARNARPVPVVLELVAAQVRSRSAVEPGEAPVGELDQRGQHLAGGEVVLTPEGVGTLTLAMFGVEGQPDGHRELDLVRVAVFVLCETQVPLVSLDTLPPVLGVARGGDDLVPEGVECVRHVEKQHLGLRPGRELLGRLGQNGVRPELTGAVELLLGGTPPGGRVPGQRGQLALDDVLECPLDGGGVEQAVADTHDDFAPLTDHTHHLFKADPSAQMTGGGFFSPHIECNIVSYMDGGHDDPLPCRRLLRCDLQR